MRRGPRSDRHRCPECRLHLSLCLCALLPRIEARTRVVLVLHQLEARKTTNSGRLAARCLAGSQVIMRGRGAPDDTAALWSTLPTPVLLYPAPDAHPIERWATGKPITLVVPDGTWNQTRRARRRVPGLGALPCARLPDGVASRYHLRSTGQPGRFSTLEAIAHALAVVDGPAVAEPLLRIFRVMVDRTLWSNGRLPGHLVTGGLPPGVASHDPHSGPAQALGAGPPAR